MARESYDYVVVGAGSAGCAVAARLSEDPGVTVALIEAGPPAKGRLFEIPALFSQQLKTAFDWDFQTEPEPRLGGRRAYLPRGRAIGGTSSMNTMLYVRGHRYDYDTWERLGNPGWGYDDVLPFFKKSEDNQRGADDFHGVGGPLTVSNPNSVHPLLTAWVEAAQDAGHKYNSDFNGAEQEGVGYHQVTQRNGLRCSSAIAFLEPAAGRPNLTVLPSTIALRLSFDGSRAAGLEVDHLGTVRTIHVDREIVLSLGAYNSPHLLLQSGVGPADELTAGGVTPLHDLPDVGRNMQDHTGCFISFFSDTEPLLGPDTSAEERLLREQGTGPMAWNETGGFFSSGDDVPAPDIQVHAALGIVRDEGLAAPLEPGMSFGPYVARPASRGSVRLRHSHPYAKPRIFHNYLDDPDDRRRLREGVRLCMRIAREQRLTSLLQSDLRGAADAGLAPVSDSDQDIDDFIRTQSFSFYHPSGTCMMGKVVDHELRVRGLDNVRVADTSIMPTLVTGNTNAPAIMIGERAASFIRTSAG
ncbi:GMC family oxidoreductase N-terminal domain-containing protein [Streptomyces sp. IBSBF 2953]|uniref:GMC family oxidoreductase N-terminal domain-containing protein n=1 Tax=Streptomyces hayashii TaxID=2839966 RepID=UPI00211A7AB7|nr:GMC family oxidoreductase N-terminal domain-containing protein [Streptomyces hayashii]